jgi:cytosine/adenosine deaminase-related metal-dependent hydrolase
MRLALQGQRARDCDLQLEENRMPDVVLTSSESVVRAATLGGAAAMGASSRLGTIQPGKAADLITLRGTDVNLAPLNDAIGSIVLQASPANVDTVIVAGRFRKRAGSLLCDESALRRRLLASRERIFAAVERAGGFFPEIDLGF